MLELGDQRNRKETVIKFCKMKIVPELFFDENRESSIDFAK